MAEEQDDKAPLAGLGELSAKRPGAAAEQSESLRLAQHHVEVRVTGHVARTVIEESFANDSEHELEGIFRFPLPPDAELDALALEVDGRWEEGAFVARARARKIWRGVIRQATPRSLRKKKEEFIWVPGPWRDPALLEWQQGGRFELRIFPIPARGVRRVRLSYRQRLPRVGKLRRYRYPLAFASDASTTIGDFRFALHTDAGKTLYAPGYRLTRSKAQGKRTRHSITGRDFLPNGDIHIDLPVRFGARELSWWTYSGPATVAPGDRSRAEDAAVSARQSAWHRDERAYVLFALRPDFPAEPKRIDRDVALVVDTSQSMVGERARRAFRLVEATLQHMDRRDRFTVLACDLHCKAFPGGLQSPSRARTAQVMRFLRQHGIAGASNIARFVRAGQAALQASARDRHVLYIGDGMSSTGARRLPTLRAAARMLRQNGAALHTVAVGGEADLQAMRALAQAGGGAMQRFVPGQHADAAGLSVVQTLAGNRLQAVRVTLPPGLTAVAPATGRLPNLRRGEELLVAARFTGAVRGQLTVSGSLSGRPWQRSYPVDLQPAEQPGNRFVAASWARQQIAAREQDSHPDAVIEAVALSKAFGVLSRHTSLLVLESEAMLRAFGIDRQGERPTWSGEEDVALGGE
ncbi:MAG: VIT domain-containing protein, partial [Polyangiales bacterium]